MHIHQYTDIDLNGLKDQMSYTRLEVHAPSHNLPLNMSQAQPCVGGKKVIPLYFEPEDRR